MRRIDCLVVSLLLIGASCGGTSSTSENATPEQACSDASETLCSTLERCAPFFFGVVWTDHATCVARSAFNCPKSFGLDGTSATPASLEACLMAARGATCGDVFRGIEACYTQPGTLMNGHACATHAQCQSAFCNPTAAGDGCGVCADKAAAGAACTVDEQCANGQKCVNIGTLAMPNKICVAYRSQGDACSANEPCTPDLACKSGTCQPPDAPGAMCSNMPDTCSAATTGDTCVAGICKSSLKIAKAGETCGLDLVAQTFTVCTGAAMCKTTGTSSVCLAAAEDGAACNPATGPHCMPPAYCDNGLCKLRDPTSCR
jgi:hypothetical protein